MNNLYEGRRQKAEGRRQETGFRRQDSGDCLYLFSLLPTPHTPPLLRCRGGLGGSHPTPHTPHPLLITENALVCVLPIWWVQ
ncbi:hypothetical protein M8120_13240 [Microcystis aeruginosa str. Chao 1910]|uniref:hypothetical protein n=1 Tax=Microcystis aeruginosa TaxID=1126 RepID=UPI002245256F|nr:hypothetical protein [Microcystis aeruginosa]UZO78748.1 hypothetical protein M8120_13240 [Microcystis aeruginosa str. Chao 1910]